MKKLNIECLSLWKAELNKPKKIKITTYKTNTKTKPLKQYSDGSNKR